MRAHRVCYPQAGTQIVRILHPVQHQKQRRLGRIFQHLLQRSGRGSCLDKGDYTLMSRASCQTIESRCVGMVNGHPACAGQIRHLAGPRIVAAGIQEDFEYPLRPALERRGDRVQPVNRAPAAHLPFDFVSSSTKSILLVSRSTRTSLTDTLSPSRKRLPVRSPRS